MTTETLSPTPVQRFYDNNGVPLSGGKLFTYIAGTTTKQSTFTDSTGLTPNANPTIMDFRGEARVWIPPNVAYKYVLAPSTDTDPPTNPIWTVDQLVNSQLITLYGGVDSGTVNSYALNFAANFTAYADGIFITWIPTSTNTGPSTINVNAIGVVNIVNFDGVALVAGQITVGQAATILFKSGQFLLISSTTSYNTATIVWGGFSANPASAIINYRKNQNQVSLIMLIGTGTSNQTLFQIQSLPAVLRPLITQSVPCVGLVDNGVALAAGMAQISPAGIISFFKDATQPLWTAAGAKGFNVNTLLTYSI